MQPIELKLGAQSPRGNTQTVSSKEGTPRKQSAPSTPAPSAPHRPATAASALGKSSVPPTATPRPPSGRVNPSLSASMTVHLQRSLTAGRIPFEDPSEQQTSQVASTPTPSESRSTSRIHLGPAEVVSTWPRERPTTARVSAALSATVAKSTIPRPQSSGAQVKQTIGSVAHQSTHQEKLLNTLQPLLSQDSRFPTSEALEACAIAIAQIGDRLNLVSEKAFNDQAERDEGRANMTERVPIWAFVERLKEVAGGAFSSQMEDYFQTDLPQLIHDDLVPYLEQEITSSKSKEMAAWESVKARRSELKEIQKEMGHMRGHHVFESNKQWAMLWSEARNAEAKRNEMDDFSQRILDGGTQHVLASRKLEQEVAAKQKEKELVSPKKGGAFNNLATTIHRPPQQAERRIQLTRSERLEALKRRLRQSAGVSESGASFLEEEDTIGPYATRQSVGEEYYRNDHTTGVSRKGANAGAKDGAVRGMTDQALLIRVAQQSLKAEEERLSKDGHLGEEDPKGVIHLSRDARLAGVEGEAFVPEYIADAAKAGSRSAQTLVAELVTEWDALVTDGALSHYLYNYGGVGGEEEDAQDRAAASPTSPASPSHNGLKRSANNSFASNSYRPPSHTLQVGGGVVFSDELAALDYNSMYVNTDNPYLVLRRMEQQCVEDRSRIERLTKRYDALFSRYVKEKTDLLENNKVYQKYLEMKRSERHSEMDIARLELVRAELIAKTEIMKGALERDEADTLKGEEARLAELKRLLVAVELAQGQKVAIIERTGDATSEAARLRGELLAMRGCKSRVDAERSAAVASLQQLRPANPHAIGPTPLQLIADGPALKSPPEVFSRTLSTVSASRVAAPISHKPAQLNMAPALNRRRQTIPSPAVGFCPYPIPNLIRGPTHLHDRLFITLPHLFLPVFAPYYAMLTSGRRVEGYRSNTTKAGDSSGSKPQSFAAIMSLASAVLPSRNTSVASQGDWRALLTLMRRNGNNPLLLLPNAERGPHRGAHSRHKVSPSDTQQKTATAQKRQSAATAGTASSAGSITAANLIALDEGGQGNIGSNDYTANQRRASSASQAMREARRRSSVASTATTASVWTRNRARAASVASTIRVVGNNGRRLSMASTIKSIAKYGGEGATGDLLGLLAPTGNSSSGVQAGGGNKSIISLAAKGGKYSAAPQQLLSTSQQQHPTAAIGGYATNEDANSNLAFGFGRVPHASLPFIGPITSASGHIPNTNQAQPARGNQVSGISRASTQNKSASSPGVGHANNTGNSEVQGADQHASALALGLLQDEVAEGAVYWRNEGDVNSNMLFPLAVAATTNPTGGEATHSVSFQIGDEDSTSQQISAYPYPSERSHLTALAGRIGKAASEFEQTGDTATADNHPQGSEPPLSLSDEEDLPGDAVPPSTQGPASAAALSWVECWPLLSSLGLASPLPSAPKTLLDQYAVVAAKTTSQHFNGFQSRTATEPSTGTNKRSSVSTFTATAALPVPLTDGHDLDSTANATITSALFQLLRPLLATNLEAMPPSPAPAATVLEELGGNNRRRESYYYAKDIDVDDNDDGIIDASRSVTPKPPTIAEQPSGQGLAPVPIPRLLKVAFGGLLLGSVLPSHPLVNIALEKQVLPTEQASNSTNLTNGAAMATSAGRHHVLSSDPLLAVFPLKAPAATTIEDMSTSHKNNRHKAALLMINRRRDAPEYSPSTATMPMDTSSDDEDEGGLSPQNPPLLPLSILLWGRGGRLMRQIQEGSHSGNYTTSTSSSALLWAFLEALARLDTSLWSPTMSRQALDKELAALGVGNTPSHHRIQHLQRELEAEEEAVRTYFYVPVAPSTAARMLDRLKGSSTSTSPPIPPTPPASISPNSPTTVASSSQHDAITGPVSQSSPPPGDGISVPPIAQSEAEAIPFPSAEAISYLHLLHWVATRRVGRYHRHRQHGSTQASVAGADRPGKASERLDKLDMANEEGNDEPPAAADTEPSSEAKHLQQKQLRRALGAPFLEAVDGVLWVSKLDLYMSSLHANTPSPSAFVRPPPLTQPQEEQLALAMQLWLHRCGLGATVGGAYGPGTEGLSSELLPLLRSPVGMADEGRESDGAAATVSIQPILWLASDRRGNVEGPSGYSVVESLACTSSPADAQFLLAKMAEVVSSMAAAASASEAKSVTDALLPFIYKKAMISFDGPLSRPTSPHPQPESSPKSTTPTRAMVPVRSPPPSPKPQPLFGAAPHLPRFASAETRSLHSLRAWLVRHLASPLLLVISATAAASTLSQPLVSSSHHPSHTESLHQGQALAANTRSAADASARMAEAADQLHAAAGLVATATYKVLQGAIREYAGINRGTTNATEADYKVANAAASPTKTGGPSSPRRASLDGGLQTLVATATYKVLQGAIREYAGINRGTTNATEADYKVANAAASPTKTGGPSSPRRASLDGGLQAPMVHVVRQALLQALTACFYVTIYPSHHHTTSSSANNAGGAAQMPLNLPQGAGMVPYGETPSEFLAVGGFEHRTPQQSTVAAAQPADALAGLKGASLALPHPHTLPLSHPSEIAMAVGPLPFAALPSDALDDLYHHKEAASLCSWLLAPAQLQLQTLSPPATLRARLATFAIPQLGSGNLSSTSAIRGGSYVPIGLAASIYSLVLGPTVAFAVGGSGWSGASGGLNPLRAATMRFNAKASQALTGHQPPLAAPTAPKGLRHFRTDAPSHQQNNTSGLPPASILASSAALHYSPLSVALLKAVGAGSPSAFLSISAGVLPTDNSTTSSSGYGPSNSSGISYRLPMEYRLVAAANAASAIASATLQSAADGVSPTATNGDNVDVVVVPQRQPRRRGKGGPGVGSGALAATSPNLVGTSASPAENFFDSLVLLGTEVARQKAPQASSTVSSMLPASASTIVLAHRKTATAFVAVVKSLVFGRVKDSSKALLLLEQHRSMPTRRYGSFLASYECYQTMCELLIEAMRAAKALKSIPTYVLPIAPNALHAVDSLRVALQRSFGESAIMPFSNNRRHDTATTISQRVLHDMDQHALIQCLWGIILQAGRSRWMGRYIAAKEGATVLGTEVQPPQKSPHHDSYALQRLHLYLTNRGSVALPATTGIPPSKASLAEALAVGVVTSPVSDLVTAATALRRGPDTSSLAEVNSIKFSRSDEGGALATDQLLRIALLQVVAGDIGIDSDDINSTNACNGAAGQDALIAKVSDLWSDMRMQMALALSMGHRPSSPPGKSVSVRDGNHQFLSSAEFLSTAVTLGEFVAEDSLKLMPPTASVNPTASGPLSRRTMAATKGSKRGQAAEPIFEDGLDDDEAGSYNPQGSQLPTEGVGVSDDAALEFLRQVRKPNAFARHMAEIANGERVGLQAHKAAAAAAYSLELTTTVDTKAVGPELKAAAKRIFSSIPFSILGASAANVNALSADPTLASIGSQRSLAHSSSTLSGGNKSTGHSMTNKSIRSVNSTTQQNPLEALLGSTPSLSGSKKLTKKATTLSMASSAFAAATTYSSSSSAVAGGNYQPANITGGGGRRKQANKTPIAKPLGSSRNRLFAASGRWRQLYSLLLRHTIPGGVSAFTTNSVESIVADTISVTTAKQATAAIASQSLLQIGIEAAEGSHEATTMSVTSAVADAVAHHLTIDHATWTSHSQRLADRLYATAAAMQDKPKATTGYYSSSRASSSAASMTEGEGTERVANNDEVEGGDVAGSRLRSSSIKSKVPQRPPGGGSAPVSSRQLRANRSNMTITNARQMLSEALNSQTTERAPPPYGLVEAYRALQLIDGVRSRATYAVAMAAVCDKQAEVEEDARKRASAANRKAQTKKANPLTFAAPFGAHPSQQSQSGALRPLSAYEQAIVALAAKPTIVNASSEHYLFDAHVSSSQYGSTAQTSASDGVGAVTTAKPAFICVPSSSLAKTLMGRKGLSRSAMASSAFGANPSMGRSVGSKSSKGVALMGSKGGTSSKGRARLAFTEPAAADATGSVIRRGDGSPPPPKRSPPKTASKKVPTAPAKKSPTTNRDTTPPGREPMEEKGLPTSILVRNKGKKAAPPSPSSGIGSERASAKGKDLRSSSRFPKDEGVDEASEDRASVDSSTSAMSSADEGQNPFSISEGEPSHSTTPPPFTFGTSPSPFGVSPQPRGTRSPQPLPPSMGRSHVGRAPFHPMASDGDDANLLRKKFRSKIRKAVTKGASAERPSLWRATVGNPHQDTNPRDLGAEFATVFYRAAVEGSLPVALLDAAYAQVIEAEIVMRAATGIGGTLSMLSTHTTPQEVSSPLFTSDTARPGSATATLPTNNVPPPSIFSQCSQLSLPHSLTKGQTSQSTERGSPVPSPNGDAPPLVSLPPTDEAFHILKAKLLSYLSGKGLLDLLVVAPSPGSRGGGLGSSFLHSPRKTSMFQQLSPHPNRPSVDGQLMSDEGSSSVEASLPSLASSQPTLILFKALKAFAAEYNGTSMLNGLALPLDRAALAALLRVGSPISAQGLSSPSASGVGRYGGAQRLSLSIAAGASTISPPATANTASALVTSMSESPSLNNPRLLLNSFGELHSHLAQHIGGALAAMHAAANPAPAAPTARIVSTAPSVTLLSEQTFFNNESISKLVRVLDPLLSKSLRGSPFWQSQGSALEQSASVVRYLATQAAQQSQRQQQQQPASLAVPGSLWKHRASEDSGSVVMLSQPLSILARLSLPLSISSTPSLPAAVAGHQPTLPPRPPPQPRAGLPNNLTALGGNDFMSTSLTNAEGPDAILSARIVQSVATTAIPLEYFKALPSPQQLRAWCSAATDGHLRAAHTSPQYLQSILSQIRPRPTLGAVGTSPFMSLPHPLMMLMSAPTSAAISSSFSSPQQQLLASVVSSLAKRQDALVGYLLDTIVQHGLATITRQEYHRKFEWLKRSAAAARVRDLDHEALKTARSGNYHNKNVSVTGGGGGGGPTSPGQLPTVATAVVTVTSLLRKLSEMADGPANGALAPSKSPVPMGGQADPTSTAYYNYLDQFLPSSSFEGGVASSSQAPFGVASVVQTSPLGGLAGPVLGKLLQLMEPYGDLDADDNIFVLSTSEPGRVFVRPKALLALLNKHSSNAPSNEFFRKSPHQSKSGSHANLLRSETEPSSAIGEASKSFSPSLVSVAVAMERVAAKEHKLLPVSLKAIATDAANQRLSIADTVTFSSNEGTNTVHANLFASALSASPAALNSLDETTAKDGFGFGGGPRSTIRGGGGSVFARRVGNAAMTDADLDTDDQPKMGRLAGRSQRNAKTTADSHAAANSNFNETEDERRQRRYRNEVISLFSRQLEEKEESASNAATALVSFANETFVCQRQHSASVTATGSAASVTSLSHGHELIVHTPTNFTITSNHWASLLNMYLSTKTASMAQNTCATLTRLLGRRHARREGRKTQRKTKLIAVANLLMSAGLSAKEAGGVASRAPPAAADGSSSAAAASFMAATMSSRSNVLESAASSSTSAQQQSLHTNPMCVAAQAVGALVANMDLLEGEAYLGPSDIIGQGMDDWTALMTIPTKGKGPRRGAANSDAPTTSLRDAFNTPQDSCDESTSSSSSSNASSRSLSTEESGSASRRSSQGEGTPSRDGSASRKRSGRRRSSGAVSASDGESEGDKSATGTNNQRITKKQLPIQPSVPYSNKISSNVTIVNPLKLTFALSPAQKRQLALLRAAVRQRRRMLKVTARRRTALSNDAAMAAVGSSWCLLVTRGICPSAYEGAGVDAAMVEMPAVLGVGRLAEGMPLQNYGEFTVGQETIPQLFRSKELQSLLAPTNQSANPLQLARRRAQLASRFLNSHHFAATRRLKAQLALPEVSEPTLAALAVAYGDEEGRTGGDTARAGDFYTAIFSSSAANGDPGGSKATLHAKSASYSSAAFSAAMLRGPSIIEHLFSASASSGVLTNRSLLSLPDQRTFWADLFWLPNDRFGIGAPLPIASSSAEGLADASPKIFTANNASKIFGATSSSTASPSASAPQTAKAQTLVVRWDAHALLVGISSLCVVHSRSLHLGLASRQRTEAKGASNERSAASTASPTVVVSRLHASDASGSRQVGSSTTDVRSLFGKNAFTSIPVLVGERRTTGKKKAHKSNQNEVLALDGLVRPTSPVSFSGDSTATSTDSDSDTPSDEKAHQPFESGEFAGWARSISNSGADHDEEVGEEGSGTHTEGSSYSYYTSSSEASEWSEDDRSRSTVSTDTMSVNTDDEAEVAPPTSRVRVIEGGTKATPFSATAVVGNHQALTSQMPQVRKYPQHATVHSSEAAARRRNRRNAVSFMTKAVEIVTTPNGAHTINDAVRYSPRAAAPVTNLKQLHTHRTALAESLQGRLLAQFNFARTALCLRIVSHDAIVASLHRDESELLRHQARLAGYSAQTNQATPSSVFAVNSHAVLDGLGTAFYPSAMDRTMVLPKLPSKEQLALACRLSPLQVSSSISGQRTNPLHPFEDEDSLWDLDDLLNALQQLHLEKFLVQK